MKKTLILIMIFASLFGCNKENDDTPVAWKIVYENDDVVVEDIFFPNLNIGFASGYSITTNKGAFLKTINSGDTWEIVSSTDEKIKQIYFVSENMGYATCGYFNIVKTIDGGQTWIDLTDKALEALNLGAVDDIQNGSVYFIDANTGFMTVSYYQYSSFNAIILKTSNGGTTWQNIAEISDELFSDIYFKDNITGYIVGWITGKVYKTTNGGISWISSTDLPSTNNGQLIQFVNNNVGYVTNYESIYKTTSAGETWNELYNHGYDNLNSLYFTDENNGYVVGNGYSKKTKDGGKTWYDLGLRIGYYYKILFTNSSIGFALESYTIHKTTSAGEGKSE